MLDIGWSEMLMIAVVAIVVIGPKDLPRTLRTIGQWIGKARGMTRDLQNSVNDMIADSELDELRKASNSIGDFSPEGYLNQPFDADASPTGRDSGPEAYLTPPPTPMKWPPDDGADEALAEAADRAPDLTDDEEAESGTPAKNTDA
ncbi:MAG: Sec-independent protein translocase protein TatB [Proteobacteria bacterium]|nr:Sec-independent protein translocase protein TatB [Pseudomonadota bacterium]